MQLQLVRHAYMREATLGWLMVGDLRLATIEEGWKPDVDGPGGQRREGTLIESCIPDGRYTLDPHSGPKKKNVWALSNPMLGVYRNPGDMPLNQHWGRCAILIHAGNSTDDIEGCIAIGLAHGYQMGRHWIYDSLKALEQLREVLGRESHVITVRPTAGTLEIAA